MGIRNSISNIRTHDMDGEMEALPKCSVPMCKSSRSSMLAASPMYEILHRESRISGSYFCHSEGISLTFSAEEHHMVRKHFLHTSGKNLGYIEGKVKKALEHGFSRILDIIKK